jgi:hypothetical protein
MYPSHIPLRVPQVLLDFQLGNHESFLEHFKRLFRRFDTDGNGVLSDGTRCL